MHSAQQKQKLQYDRRQRDVVYNVGDRVLLATDHLNLAGHRKFREKFVGPFTISARVVELAYKLELPKTMRMHPVFHVSRLKTYVEGGGDGV